MFFFFVEKYNSIKSTLNYCLPWIKYTFIINIVWWWIDYFLSHWTLTNNERNRVKNTFITHCYFLFGWANISIRIKLNFIKPLFTSVSPVFSLQFDHYQNYWVKYCFLAPDLFGWMNDFGQILENKPLNGNEDGFIKKILGIRLRKLKFFWKILKKLWKKFKKNSFNSMKWWQFKKMMKIRRID